MANLKKQSQVDSLIELIKSAENFTLVRYEKTTHTNLENLRKQLKKNNSSIKVLKNTLLEKALNKLAIQDKAIHDFKIQVMPLKHNNAFISLGKEWNKGLGSFSEFIKKETSMTFHTGLLDHKAYKPAEMEKIAKLPPKDQLLAKVIGGMKSPLAKTTRALQFNMQKFVYILNAKAKQN